MTRPFGAAVSSCLLAIASPAPSSAQQSTDVRPFLAALSTTSVHQTATWYRDHFGFRILSLDTLSRPGISAALLERGGFYLEVVAVSGSRPRTDALPNSASNASLQGLYKLGLWVPDADSAAHVLQRAGVSLYRPLAADSSLAGGVRYFLVRDPDGTVVQVFGPLRPGTPSAPPTHDEVRAVIDTYDAAWNRRDSAMVAALLAPDYVYFSSTGRVTPRAETLALLTSTHYVLAAAARSELQVTHTAPVLAVASSRWRGHGTWRGEAFNDDQRCSLVFTRAAGQWQLVSEHCTQIAGP